MIYQGNEELRISDEFGFMREYGVMYDEQINWFAYVGGGIYHVALTIAFIACFIAFLLSAIKILTSIHKPKQLVEELSLIPTKIWAVLGCSGSGLLIGIVYTLVSKL